MAGLTFDPFSKEILEQELCGFIEGSGDSGTLQRYGPLAEEVRAGAVSEDRVAALETLLELLLDSGRARRLHGAAGENALASVYLTTPKGSALSDLAARVNGALRGIEGHTLGQIAFRAEGPGRWALSVRTDRCELLLRIDRNGLRLDQVGVELG